MAIKLRIAPKSYKIEVKRDGETSVFVVRPQTIEDERDRRERFTTVIRKGGKNEESFDWYAALLDRVCAVIQSWDVVADDGQPIPCDRDNKIAAYINSPGIIDEVLAAAADLASEESAKAKADEKN